jgi:hypothetical protein
MKIVDSPKVICSNEDSIFGYFAWPTVCLLPNTGVWEDAVIITTSYSNNTIPYYFD